jgi:hypothetical protein
MTPSRPPVLQLSRGDTGAVVRVASADQHELRLDPARAKPARSGDELADPLVPEHPRKQDDPHAPSGLRRRQDVVDVDAGAADQDRVRCAHQPVRNGGAEVVTVLEDHATAPWVEQCPEREPYRRSQRTSQQRGGREGEPHPHRRIHAAPDAADQRGEGAIDDRFERDMVHQVRPERSIRTDHLMQRPQFADRVEAGAFHVPVQYLQPGFSTRLRVSIALRQHQDVVTGVAGGDGPAEKVRGEEPVHRDQVQQARPKRPAARLHGGCCGGFAGQSHGGGLHTVHVVGKARRLWVGVRRLFAAHYPRWSS